MDVFMILVTGGCGFIGSHVCEALVERGEKIRVLDDLSAGKLENIEPVRGSVQFVNDDIRDPDALSDAMKGVSRVIHLAALVTVFESVDRPERTHGVNTTGAFNAVNAARKAGVKRIVFASSCAVYGEGDGEPLREDRLPAPGSPYAASKLHGEHCVSVFAGLYGVSGVSLRFFNVYGPRQDPSSPYSGVISRFADDAFHGRAPQVFGDGLQSRDFVYVKDVAAAILAALDSKIVGRGEVINVGTGVETSILSLVKTLGEVSGKSITPVFAPPRAADVRRICADISLARNLLGFTPRHTLKSGLENLWAHLCAAH